jgi:hypothetical protein
MEGMELFLIALAASALTLLSGFGLGNLLMPVVALFVSVELVIAITALVHLANNLFKVLLLIRDADLGVLARFGLPAILFAFIGALVLQLLADVAPLLSYSLGHKIFSVTPLKLIVGCLILVFVLLDYWPRLGHLQLDRKYLPYGGMVSSFFGVLSGHREAFLSLFVLSRP